MPASSITRLLATSRAGGPSAQSPLITRGRRRPRGSPSSPGGGTSRSDRARFPRTLAGRAGFGRRRNRHALNGRASAGNSPCSGSASGAAGDVRFGETSRGPAFEKLWMAVHGLSEARAIDLLRRRRGRHTSKPDAETGETRSSLRRSARGFGDQRALLASRILRPRFASCS